MRTRAERRNAREKSFKRRLKLCKEIRGYTGNDDKYIKTKSDIPHSLGSNFYNGFETKAMQNKQKRLKDKNNLRKEIMNE